LHVPILKRARATRPYISRFAKNIRRGRDSYFLACCITMLHLYLLYKFFISEHGV
jgi:hypothetical protein